MAYQVPRADVIDKVWMVAADGQWHSRRGLVQQTQLDREEVMAALRFLVKHGFAESSTAKEERFRITDGPSPAEVARILWALGKEPDLTHFAWL
jgi:hypothetical protein